MHKFITISSLAIIMLPGCTQFEGIHPQSHFVDPKSTVIPLGRVHGEVSDTYFFTFKGQNSNYKKMAIQNAIAQKPGATLLINYAELRKDFNLLIFGVDTYYVEGQAAKVQLNPESSRD